MKPTLRRCARGTLLLSALALAACSSGADTTQAQPAAADRGASASRPAPTAAGSQPSTAASAGPAPAQEAVPAEQNPPGDIPDDLAFVPYRSTAGHYSFTHPEGWAESTRGGSVIFTDKLNGVQVEAGTGTTRPTVVSATQQDLPVLRASQPAFQARGVQTASVPGGAGVRITYRRNSAPDPVTGRRYRDEVERYELLVGGRVLVVELYGPVGADNVDAYRTMIDSLRKA